MSGRLHDVVVAGGGPAGLALAIAAAGRGLDVLVVEARPFPVDQPCGEGLLPAGVSALEELGVRARLDPAAATPVPALRWIDPSGSMLEVTLPAPGGMGVRRSALSAVMAAAGREAGATLLEAEVLGHRRGTSEVEVRTTAGAVRGRLLVAADGRGSPIRSREGLEDALPRRARFGIRRHLAVEHWTSAVEVHFGAGVEAYLTPAGHGRLGVAFLFEGRVPGGWPALLARVPALAARLREARPLSDDRGAGPLVRGARARVLDRLVLLGDAAGSLDPLSGEGTSLALAGALELARLLPAALGAGCTRASLLGWERAWRRRQRPSAAWTALLLGLARRAALRRRVIAYGATHPGRFDGLVAWALGSG